jgi:hypothetical protein
VNLTILYNKREYFLVFRIHDCYFFALSNKYFNIERTEGDKDTKDILAREKWDEGLRYKINYSLLNFSVIP